MDRVTSSLDDSEPDGKGVADHKGEADTWIQKDEGGSRQDTKEVQEDSKGMAEDAEMWERVSQSQYLGAGRVAQLEQADSKNLVAVPRNDALQSPSSCQESLEVEINVADCIHRVCHTSSRPLPAFSFCSCWVGVPKHTQLCEIASPFQI